MKRHQFLMIAAMILMGACALVATVPSTVPDTPAETPSPSNHIIIPTSDPAQPLTTSDLNAGEWRGYTFLKDNDGGYYDQKTKD